ncbi:energy transducer TonB [Syntrophobacter fumaroxidans]|nr:energy transducer TonB [Syntrophobacter fumaroxidans]
MRSVGTYENDPGTPSVAAGKEWFQARLPGEDENEPGGDLSFLRPRVALRGDFILAAGFALAIHAAVPVLALLLHLYIPPVMEHRDPFITVTLVGAADGGVGSEKGPSGSGPGDSLPGAGPRPLTPEVIGAAREEAQSREPAAQVCAVESPKEMKPEAPREPADPVKTCVLSPAPREIPARKDRKKTDAERKPKPAPPAGASVVTAAPSSDANSGEPSSTARDDEAQGGHARGDGVRGKAGHAAGGLPGGGSPGGGGTGSGRFELKQVDQAPRPIRKVEPEYPQAARRMGVGGRVEVRFLVKTDGSVGEASVVRAEPPGVFERNALEAVNKWRFKPGCHRGEAVATWVVLSVHFRLSR